MPYLLFCSLAQDVHALGQMSIPASSPGFLLIGIQLIALLGALRWSREVRRKAAYKVNRHLRVFVEQSPLAIAMFDKQMKYVAVSARWSADYNIATPHVLLGRSHYEIFPELPERWKDVHRRCLQGSAEKCDEELFTRSDGSLQWLRWEVRPWRDGGQVGGLLIFSEDITSRKIAEERACEVTAQVEV